jgi:hypothetical protein
VFESPLAVVWGPNSQGKTSLAEAFEFLLTGTIVRRQLLASTQDEFADSLRNVHLLSGDEVFVRAEVQAIDGVHTVKRTLTADFGKREDCKSSLEIDSSPASEADLARLSLALSQPPLRAPILAQHSVGYMFSVGPQDRANYFKTLLEVTDLDAFRTAVADLDRALEPLEAPALVKLQKAESIPGVGNGLAKLRGELAGSPIAKAAVATALRSLIEGAGRRAPDGLTELANAAGGLLEEARGKTFPLRLLGSRPHATWDAPSLDSWAALDKYLEKRAKLDEGVHRLAALFAAALQVPAVAEAPGSLDCPLCGTTLALTPERIAFIREHLSATESFRRAEDAAKEALEQIERSAKSLGDSARTAGPELLAGDRLANRRAGFTLRRVRELLGAEDTELLALWVAAVRTLATTRRATLRAASRALDEAASARKRLAGLTAVEPLTEALAEADCVQAQLRGPLESYAKAETRLLSVLRAAVDASGKISGWTDLIDLARDPESLIQALEENHARREVAKELEKALKDVDRGNEKVWSEKYQHLSNDIAEWWNLLRPDEGTFFAGVRPRAGARRTTDLKAALSPSEERKDAQIRDAIAVFSQSQLHCLGLSMFLARAVRDGCRFVVLDDPVLSSDDDYRAYFEGPVIKKLLETGLQIVVLTQNHRMWTNIERLHHVCELFRLDAADPARGTLAIKTSDDLAAMLARAELLRGGDPTIVRQKATLIRVAAERLCKDLLAEEVRRSERGEAAIVEFDDKNLRALEPRVSPLLNQGPDHAGKLQMIARDTNDGAHDAPLPSQGSLKVALGNLKELVRVYRPTRSRDSA